MEADWLVSNQLIGSSHSQSLLATLGCGRQDFPYCSPPRLAKSSVAAFLFFELRRLKILGSEPFWRSGLLVWHECSPVPVNNLGSIHLFKEARPV